MNKKSVSENKLKDRINNILEKPLLTAFIVLVIVTIIVISLSLPFYLQDFNAFIAQVLAEAHGTIFDIAVIGILLYYLNQRGQIRQMIRTYKDEIDDFRLWQSEEAAFRTVGNIKRLNRHKVYDIDLVDCQLLKTNLNYVILRNANLNYANIAHSQLQEVDLVNARLNQTNFENCNMNRADMSRAYANGAIFKDANLIKAEFQGAFLIKANFSNAHLMEANLKGAYLTGADFSNANLYKTSFIGAQGLTIEQLTSARTLYLAEFDPEIEIQLKNNHPELIGT